MKKGTVILSLAVSLLLSGSGLVLAQGSYFQAVTNLNAAGYWPMHEVENPAPGNIETNYGTLGTLGNGYYNDWTALPANTGAKILRQVTGPLAGDTGTLFTNSSARSATAGFLLVPHASPLLTIKPPFTIEGWFNANLHQIGQFSSMLGQGGGGLNNSASYDGFSWNWNNPAPNPGTIWNIYCFDGSGSATSGGSIGAPSTTISSNTWYYFALTYLTNNTTYGYVNGTANGPSGTLSLPMVPSTWSPLTIGNARWNNTGNAPAFSFDGSVAEVAVYTNVLSSQDLLNHYTDGINSGAGQYFSDVTSANPLIYLRMNAPTYTPPDISTWPILTNYGTAAANGVYTPGTVPGLLTGLPSSGYPVNVSNQVPLLSGMGTFADTGNSASYNPTGSAATFSVSALFRGNPAEARVQTLVGHGTNSWTLGLTAAGKVVFNSGTNSATATGTGTGPGDLVGTGVSNDGFWHYVVAVHNQTTNFLYIDGTLVATNVSTATIPGNTLDVMIGADPSFTNATDNLGRQFSGQVTEVAFFNSALGASDVQTLFAALGVSPVITQQPVSATVNGGSSFTNSLAVNGSPTLAYQWYFNTSSNYSGARAVTNTADGRILGATAASLVFTNVHGSDAGFYYAVVTNTVGASNSLIVGLSVNTAPVINTQLPVPYTNLFTLFAGVNTTFSVGAGGASPLHYQWYTNGVVMPQATNATLTLSNVAVGFLTNYCVITNTLGSANSFVWAAAVVPAPTQAYPQAVLALGPVAYWRLDEPDDTLSDGNPGATAHDYIGGKDGIYTNAYLGQTGYSQGLASQYGYGPAIDPNVTSSRFGWFSATAGDADSIQGIDFSAPSGSNVAFSVAAWVNGQGQTSGSAGIASKGYFFNEEFTLDGGAPSKCYRFEVRGANGVAYNANSTVSAGDALWHQLVGVCDQAHGAVNLYIDGLLTGSASIPAGSGIQASNASVPMIIGARPTSATSGADAQFYGYVNDVAVYNYALSFGQAGALYNAAGVPPYFLQQPPASTNVSENTLLALAAADSGTAPITNQWWDATTGQPLAGQTNATLVISNVPGNLDGHQVYLQAANGYGAPVNSSMVTLTIITGPPTVTLDLPTPVFTPAAKPYTYSIGVAGPPPYSYQWYFNGGQIPGATASSYSFSAVSGLFKVVITNLDGPSTSTVSTLTAVSTPANPYASTILSSYGAVGYWPLQETNPPAPVNLETNYGTLGALGNAYYAVTNATNVSFAQGGALGGDLDTAVGFTGVNGTTPASFAFVPRISPALTLQPPFTWEVWVKPTSTAFGDLFAYGGGSGLNGGNWGGFRLSWGGNFQIYGNDGTSSSSFTGSTSTPGLTAGQWHYCVVTYDGSTATVYVDGNPTAVASLATGLALDTWTPLTIGAGRWQGVPTRGFNGVEDELAIYTNLLSVSDMTTHYNDGVSGGAGVYVTDVLTRHPLLYYRMDNAGFTNPSVVLYPSALNFGTAPVNGAYRPGIVPGGIAGPVLWGLGTNLLAAPINGVISCVDAGSDAAFNPTGAQPFSAATWFKAYPSDSRLQSVMSHGTNWALNLDGTTGSLVWNVNSAGTIASASVVNDGNWHFAVGVYDGSHNSLYVDGALSATANAAGSVAGDANANLFLGGDADFTAAGSQSYFGGALAQAAFFTNALSAAQVSLLYDLATDTPSISLSRSGSQLLITYSGTLVYSTNAAGPYFNVVGANPPSYTTSPSNARMFYRARQ